MFFPCVKAYYFKGKHVTETTLQIIVYYFFSFVLGQYMSKYFDRLEKISKCWLIYLFPSQFITRFWFPGMPSVCLHIKCMYSRVPRSPWTVGQISFMFCIREFIHFYPISGGLEYFGSKLRASQMGLKCKVTIFFEICSNDLNYISVIYRDHISRKIMLIKDPNTKYQFS